MFTPIRCLLLLALAGSSMMACQRDTPAPATTRIVLVQIATPTPANGAAYTGDIRARHEVDLAFRVGGKIAQRLVDVGAIVRPAQPLARIDPADLQQAAASAAAQLASAESELRTARAERERYAGLLARRFVSQAAFDAKENAFNSASARLEQARAQRNISGNQATYGTLSSETAGIVTATLADAGQVVGAGQAVFRIARPDEKEVAISVPESRLNSFKSANHFSVSLWAHPEHYLKGELRELAPAADPVTRTYAARIRLIDPPADVQLGMTARVILDATPEAGVQVPLSAVIDLGQGPLVRTVRDDRIVSQPVTIKQYREDGVSISAGLQAGERVVISGAGQLVDGEPVRTRLVTPSVEQR